MKKKKSPKEIIESVKGPERESLYIKFPGEEMKEVDIDRKPYIVGQDEEKSSRLMKEHISRRKYDQKIPPFMRGKYTQVHTHPARENWGMVALPSGGDIEGFLCNSPIKTMAIAQTDNVTGEVQGYFVLRKKERVKYEGKPPVGPDWKEKVDDSKNYQKSAWSGREDAPRDALKKLAKKYNLQYRWVPAKGYRLSDEKHGGYWRFMKKRRLEEIITAILISIGLIFLSPNITGYAIISLDKATTNISGAIILLASIILIVSIWTRRKNETSTNI